MSKCLYFTLFSSSSVQPSALLCGNSEVRTGKLFTVLAAIFQVANFITMPELTLPENMMMKNRHANCEAYCFYEPLTQTFFSNEILNIFLVDMHTSNDGVDAVFIYVQSLLPHICMIFMEGCALCFKNRV